MTAQINTHTSTYADEVSTKKKKCNLCTITGVIAFIIGLSALALAIGLTVQNDNAIRTLREDFENEVEKMKKDVIYIEDDLRKTSSRVWENERNINTLFSRLSSLKDKQDSFERDTDKYMKRGYMGYRYECIPFNGYMYEWKIGDYHTWEQARYDCLRDGGDLPVHGMKDWRSRRLIFEAMEFAQYSWPMWIGLSKDENGTWRWVNGEMARDDQTFWGEDPLSAPSNNSCGVLTRDGFLTRTWNCSSEEVLLTCEVPFKY